jgi:DNA polymerase III delta subunit
MLNAGDPAALGRLPLLAGSGSLFGGGTLITVHEAGRLRGKGASSLLEQAMATLAPGNSIALVDARSRRPSPRDAESELATLVRRLGGRVVVCASPQTGELAADLVARAQKMGREITSDAALELSRRLGGELREPDLDRRSLRAIAVSELAKLLLAVPNAVGVGPVQALVADREAGSLLAFADACLARDPAALSHHLGRALAEPAPVVVAALHRRLRELALIKGGLEAGDEPDAIATAAGLHPYAVRRISAHAARWSSNELIGAFDALVALDAVGKGGGDPRATLVRFAAGLVVDDPARLTGASPT